MPLTPLTQNTVPRATVTAVLGKGILLSPLCWQHSVLCLWLASHSSFTWVHVVANIQLLCPYSTCGSIESEHFVFSSFRVEDLFRNSIWDDVCKALTQCLDIQQAFKNVNCIIHIVWVNAVLWKMGNRQGYWMLSSQELSAWLLCIMFWKYKIASFGSWKLSLLHFMALCYLFIQQIGVCYFPSVSSLDYCMELWEKHIGRVLTICPQIAYPAKGREKWTPAFLEHALCIWGELHTFSYWLLSRTLLDRHYLHLKGNGVSKGLVSLPKVRQVGKEKVWFIPGLGHDLKKRQSSQELKDSRQRK